MKVKVFEGKLQIHPNGGFLAWFKRTRIKTRKAESVQVVLPDAMQVGNELKASWMENSKLSLLPLLFVSHKYGTETKVLVIGLIIAGAFVILDELIRHLRKSFRYRKPDIQALGVINPEPIPEPFKPDAPEGYYSDQVYWNAGSIPAIDVLKENKTYLRYTYNRLREIQSEYKKQNRKYAVGAIENMCKTWTRGKWWNEDGGKWRKAIMSVKGCDLPDWEPVKIATTPEW